LSAEKEEKGETEMKRKNQDETYSPSSHTGYGSVGGVESEKLSTLLVKGKRSGKVKHQKPEGKEVLVREEIRWWGFSEMLDINPKPRGEEMSLDNCEPNPLVNRKPVRQESLF
jgi:hypothetical protein